MKTSRVALIDADELSYKVALKYQKKVYTVLRDDKVLWKCEYKQDAVESIENATDLEIGEYIEEYELKGHENTIDSIINSITTTSLCSSHLLYLSGTDNFRYKRATLLPYKANRPEKPVHLQTIRDSFRDRGAESVDFLEADDLLSIYNNQLGNAVICTSDKDLSTVPSINYNISNRTLSTITPLQAAYNFYVQLMIGDSTDNIPSPYLLGKTKATKFLDSCIDNKSFINQEIDWYHKSFIPFYKSFLLAKGSDGYKTKWYSNQDIEEVLLEIGDLLWMRRTLDPNEHWHPDLRL